MSNNNNSVLISNGGGAEAAEASSNGQQLFKNDVIHRSLAADVGVNRNARGSGLNNHRTNTKQLATTMKRKAGTKKHNNNKKVVPPFSPNGNKNHSSGATTKLKHSSTEFESSPSSSFETAKCFSLSPNTQRGVLETTKPANKRHRKNSLPVSARNSTSPSGSVSTTTTCLTENERPSKKSGTSIQQKSAAGPIPENKNYSLSSAGARHMNANGTHETYGQQNCFKPSSSPKTCDPELSPLAMLVRTCHNIGANDTNNSNSKNSTWLDDSRNSLSFLSGKTLVGEVGGGKRARSKSPSHLTGSRAFNLVDANQAHNKYPANNLSNPTLKISSTSSTPMSTPLLPNATSAMAAKSFAGMPPVLSGAYNNYCDLQNGFTYGQALSRSHPCFQSYATAVDAHNNTTPTSAAGIDACSQFLLPFLFPHYPSTSPSSSSSAAVLHNNMLAMYFQQQLAASGSNKPGFPGNFMQNSSVMPGSGADSGAIAGGMPNYSNLLAMLAAKFSATPPNISAALPSPANTAAFNPFVKPASFSPAIVAPAKPTPDYICSWSTPTGVADGGYCGKRCSTADDLAAHVQSHIADMVTGNAGAASSASNYGAFCAPGGTQNNTASLPIADPIHALLASAYTHSLMSLMATPPVPPHGQSGLTGNGFQSPSFKYADMLASSSASSSKTAPFLWQYAAALQSAAEKTPPVSSANV